MAKLRSSGSGASDLRGPGPSATTALLTAAATGCVVGVAVGLFGSWRYGVLLGWIAAAMLFLGRLWWTVWPMDPRATRQHARREDPRQSLSDTAMLVAAVFSLIAVALLLTGSAGSAGDKTQQAALSVCSVALSWGVVHSVFTTRYARMFYDDTEVGFDFNGDNQPRYSDFAYVAFTVGMTFQVSDTQVDSWVMRRVVLRHSLLSYLFGAFIIATLINLIGGLGS